MSHCVILNGGITKKFVAGQTSNLVSWNGSGKTLPNGTAMISWQVSDPQFILSGSSTIGYQDCSLKITYSCAGQIPVTVECDLIPSGTLCLAADFITMDVTIAAPQALPNWPGVSQLTVSVNGTYGHGYRLNRATRSIQATGKDASNPLRLYRPDFATRVFGRVSAQTSGSTPTGYFRTFGNNGAVTYIERMWGAISGGPRVVDLPLCSQDRYAEIAPGAITTYATLGYILEF